MQSKKERWSRKTGITIAMVHAPLALRWIMKKTDANQFGSIAEANGMCWLWIKK
jgi:hypothetical protein